MSGTILRLVRVLSATCNTESRCRYDLVPLRPAVRHGLPCQATVMTNARRSSGQRTLSYRRSGTSQRVGRIGRIWSSRTGSTTNSNENGRAFLRIAVPRRGRRCSVPVWGQPPVLPGTVPPVGMAMRSAARNHNAHSKDSAHRSTLILQDDEPAICIGLTPHRLQLGVGRAPAETHTDRAPGPQVT